MNRHGLSVGGRCVPLILAGLLTLATHNPAGAVDWTPLSIGTAGAGMMMSFGLDAAFENPANLGLRVPERLQFRMFGLGAGIANNGFGWGDYRQYNGSTIDTGDKEAILAKVPADGLRLLADGTATAMATRLGRWSLQASAFGSAGGRIDRDVIALLLYGNAERSAWDFSNTDGEGLAAWRVSLSHGQAIGHPGGTSLYAGFSLSYIRGLYYAGATDTYANLATQSDGLTGTARTNMTTAEGGAGFGVDLGLAWDAGQQWLAGLTIENVFNRIRWDQNPQEHYYSVSFDELTVNNFDDSLIVTEDRVESSGAFNRGLPAQIRLGLAHMGNRLHVSTEVAVALANRFAFSTTPRLATGIEYLVFRALPVRFGISAGGATGFAVGWGTGLHLGSVRLDTGIRIDRGLWVGNGRGLTGSLAMDIAF